uniref:Transposase MuDR plant domain-containing protein n=1 Tax=Glycine max TaxID=3847 RepID=K7K378_SOYBN
MDEVEYIGLAPSNVDILVHFMDQRGEPSEICNVDSDKFGMFGTHDCVNNIANDLELPPCHPFILWFHSTASGKILPFKTDANVLNMFVENQNSIYIHMYASRTKDEFWNLHEHVIENVNEHVIENMKEPVNENVNEPVNENVNEPMNESMNELVNVSGQFIDDKVYASDDDKSYEMDKIENQSSESEYDLIGEYGDWSVENQSDCVSDFEETRDVIGNLHFDDDMSDIYVERGVLGKPCEKEKDARIKLEVDQLFLNVNHFREVLKDFSIQERFKLRRVKNEKTIVTCKCVDVECTWRIHASPNLDGVTFKLKTYNEIAKKLESILVADPNICYSTMKQVLLDKHGLEPSNLMQLYRAKRKKGDVNVESVQANVVCSQQSEVTTHPKLCYNLDFDN